MANFKISQLTQAVPATADLIPFVDVDDTLTSPAGSGGSDKVTTVASLLNPATLRRIPVDLYGADPTGSADSTAAFVAAQAAGGGAYQLVLSAGTYKIGTASDISTFGRNQGMQGAGSALTTINYAGNGTCINAWDSSFSSSLSVGAPFGGFTIGGGSAGASAVGMRWGDLLLARCSDIVIQGFTGASAIGLYLHNVSGWSEEGEWTGIKLSNNTASVVFDSGSCDYSLYQFTIYANANQDGIRMQNGAALEGVRLELRGNFVAGVTNTGAVFALDRGNASGTCRIDGAQLYVSVECDGSSGTGHQSILMGSTSASSQFNGEGVLQFRNLTVSFQAASIGNSSNVWFSGLVSMAGVNARPQPNWQAYDYQVAAFTCDPSIANGNQLPASGHIYMWGVQVRHPVRVSTIMIPVTAAGASGVTAAQNYVGLYNQAGTQLASTGVDSAFGGSFTNVLVSITAQTLQPGLYWIAFLMNATTMPTLARGSGLSSTVANLNLPAGSHRFATYGTGTTLPGTITPGSMTSDANCFLAAIY